MKEQSKARELERRTQTVIHEFNRKYGLGIDSALQAELVIWIGNTYRDMEEEGERKNEKGERSMKRKDAMKRLAEVLQIADMDSLIVAAGDPEETMRTIRHEIANRGAGKRGEWVGFPKAEELWCK